MTWAFRLAPTARPIDRGAQESARAHVSRSAGETSSRCVASEALRREPFVRKRTALFFGVLSLPFLMHAYLLSLLLGFLFVVICGLNVVKFEHQLWQIETGLADPD